MDMYITCTVLIVKASSRWTVVDMHGCPYPLDIHMLFYECYVMIFSTSPLPVMAASDEAGLISTVVSCINTLHSCLASLLPDQFHANDIAQMQKPGVGRLSRPPAISASLGFLSPDSWKNLAKICKKKYSFVSKIKILNEY